MMIRAPNELTLPTNSIKLNNPRTFLCLRAAVQPVTFPKTIGRQKFFSPDKRVHIAAYSKYGDRGGRSSIPGLCSSREVLTESQKIS